MDQVQNMELSKDQIIQELIALLNQNQQKEAANDVFEMATLIDGMGKRLEQVTEELSSVRKQLEKMEQEKADKTLKATVRKAVESLEQQCQKMKEQLFEIKTEVKAKASEIVAEAKAKGKAALHKVSEFLGIKDKLEFVRENVHKSIAVTEHTINKLDAFGSGMRDAGQKITNTFRTFADKETVDYSEKEKKFSKQIFTDNAELAWASALRYRDILLSGRDTLQNKKNFVSSFHNAIELYTKQLMIFNNDYRVIDIKNDEKDGHFAKEYFASENLDVFFTNLKKEELIKLRTCDFSKMPINEIYGQCKEKPIDPDGAIKLLTRLRNEETHFAFSNEFMTDSEFIKLDRFLLRYYKILMDVGLLPKCFGRRKSFINSIENRLVPNDNNRCNAQKGFTFKKRLQESGRCSFNKKFIEEIEGKSFESYGKDAFGITEAVYYQSEELSGKFSFEEIWDYIVSYLKYELISVEENVETAIDMDSNAGWNTYISIKWKGTR